MAKIEMTQKIALDNAINYLLGNEMPEDWNFDGTIEKLQKMKEQVVKKSSSKASKIDAKLVTDVLVAFATCEEPLTVGMAIEAFDCLKGMKSQKVTPIFTKLVGEGKLNKVITKGRAFYLLAE